MSVVIEHIEKYDLHDKKLLLACSGGSDSVVLFHALIQLKIKFAVVHVNYQLRGNESEGDEEFVSELCKKHNVPIHVARCPTEVTLGTGRNLQNEARKFRHTLFQQWNALGNDHRVLLAHHEDDQTETFFLQYFRGSGSLGLSGMKADDNQLIRPFLNLSKNQLKAFAVENKISWREDSSNTQSNYLRNLFRNVLIPDLIKDIPNLVSGIQLFQSHLQHYHSELDQSNKLKIEGIVNSRQLPIETWNKWKDIEHFLFLKHLNEPAWLKSRLDELMNSEFSTEVSSENFIFIKGRNVIHFRRKNEQKKDWEYKILTNNTPFETDKSNLAISENILLEQIKLRFLGPKDKIQLRGMKGRKLIWDILKEAGIPKQLRSETPVFEIDGEIIWVPGFAISNHPFVKNDNSSTVLLKLIEKVK